MTKKIWIYWEQGWDKARNHNITCLNSWIMRNPSWEVIILDKNKLKDYVDVFEINKDFWKIRPIQTRSDLIRTLLLKTYGGVWVDATLYCWDSLDNWLPDDDFFAFSYKAGRKKSSGCISSWFLASINDNYIINTFTEKYFSYFKNNLTANHYFQFHRTFNAIYKTDHVFQNQFKNMKFMPAPRARLFKYKRKKIHNKNFKPSMLAELNFPVYKLSNKLKGRGRNYTKIFKYLKELNNPYSLSFLEMAEHKRSKKLEQ